MDMQGSSAAALALAASVLQPVSRRQGRPANAMLGSAQPSMGQGVARSAPLDVVPNTAVLEVDGDIVIRRRASSVSVSEVEQRPGAHELAFVRQLAKDFRRENKSGANKGVREMRKLGFDRQLIDDLFARHQTYGRTMRALAGGRVRASEAQWAQAFALCVFDVNRTIFMRESMEIPEPSDTTGASRPSSGDTSFQRIVVGAKRLTGFDDLRPTVELWVHLRLDPRGAEREVMVLSLANAIGLFHTNARRFMNAYEEAISGGRHADLLQRLPPCLAKQWMSGCGDQERDALRSASGEQTELFHRKLVQQYALLCRRFGLPLPALAELILVDGDERDLPS